MEQGLGFSPQHTNRQTCYLRANRSKETGSALASDLSLCQDTFCHLANPSVSVTSANTQWKCMKTIILFGTGTAFPANSNSQKRVSHFQGTPTSWEAAYLMLSKANPKTWRGLQSEVTDTQAREPPSWTPSPVRPFADSSLVTIGPRQHKRPQVQPPT